MVTVFEWSGKTMQGLVESGEMTASTREEVIAHLRRRNITATLVTEKAKKARKLSVLSFGGGVKDKDIVVFTRQFATI